MLRIHICAVPPANTPLLVYYVIVKDHCTNLCFFFSYVSAADTPTALPRVITACKSIYYFITNP